MCLQCDSSNLSVYVQAAHLGMLTLGYSPNRIFGVLLLCSNQKVGGSIPGSCCLRVAVSLGTLYCIIPFVMSDFECSLNNET